MTNHWLIIPVAAVACYLFGYYRMFTVYAGLLLQILYLFSRGSSLGRMPIVGPHDTLFFLSASIVLFGIAVTAGREDRQKLLNPIVGLGIFFVLLSLLFRPHDFPLPPVLKTIWFETHVALSFFAYALFGIAAVLGVYFLRNGDERVEVLQYKAILVGYCLFSAAMIFGGIWAYLAWGTYWLWTPKELWTVILWLFYSLYLHARLRPWWSGRPATLLGIAGFLVVMFTYLGVSLLMKSSHSF
jgi:ABC-type transport system involved in cytochrome c biogenesis permease subunit